MADPIYGTDQPTVRDTQTVLLTKILETLIAISAGGGGGGGSYTDGGNFYGDGDPNGVVTASRGAIYTQLDVSPPAIWFKTTDSNNTGWE